MADTPRVLFKEGVCVRDEPPLTVDVFIPPVPTENRPALVLLHGGAWKFGDRSQLRGYGFLVSREGFVVIAGEFRLAPGDVWPAQLEDVAAVFDWVVAESKELGIDPHRIAVAGASSGGHLALMLAGSRSAEPLLGSCPAAVVSLYGITDLAGTPALSDAIADLLGNSAEGDRHGASPVAYLTARHPPTLLLHSNADEIVPRQQALDYYERLLGQGVVTELAMFDGAHAFDVDPQLGRQVAATMASFLHRHLPPEVSS